MKRISSVNEDMRTDWLFISIVTAPVSNPQSQSTSTTQRTRTERRRTINTRSLRAQDAHDFIVILEQGRNLPFVIPRQFTIRIDLHQQDLHFKAMLHQLLGHAAQSQSDHFSRVDCHRVLSAGCIAVPRGIGGTRGQRRDQASASVAFCGGGLTILRRQNPDNALE